MDWDNPIVRAGAVEALERLVEQVRRDRDRFRAQAHFYEAHRHDVDADLCRKFAAEAERTLRAVLGEEDGG